MTEYRIITAPVIIPLRPDCDYQQGEPPLTHQQIKEFKNSYDDYQIIDYDHEITQPSSQWYLRTLGEPIKSWISSSDTTYTNVAGNTETIPRGTWWLTSRITDPEAIRLIDSGALSAYSITVGNKLYCDNFLKKLYGSKHTTPPEEDNIASEVNLAFKKTLIKDITNPVGFTVSLTGMPCVSSALFSRKCLRESQQSTLSNKNGGENMESNENRFSVSELLGLQKIFANKNTQEEPKKEEKPAEAGDKTPTKAPEQEAPEADYVTREELDEKLEQNKEEIIKVIDDRLEKVVEKLTSQKEEPKKEEEEEEGDSKASEEEEPKDATANKNNTPSSQLDNTDDGHNLNTANKSRTSTKAQMMAQLNRKPNGEYKFPRNH